MKKYLLAILVILLIFGATNTIINIHRHINSFRHDPLPKDFMKDFDRDMEKLDKDMKNLFK